MVSFDWSAALVVSCVTVSVSMALRAIVSAVVAIFIDRGDDLYGLSGMLVDNTLLVRLWFSTLWMMSDIWWLASDTEPIILRRYRMKWLTERAISPTSSYLLIVISAVRSASPDDNDSILFRRAARRRVRREKAIKQNTIIVAAIGAG